MVKTKKYVLKTGSGSWSWSGSGSWSWSGSGSY
jgi:hypothetical protein